MEHLRVQFATGRLFQRIALIIARRGLGRASRGATLRRPGQPGRRQTLGL